MPQERTKAAASWRSSASTRRTAAGLNAEMVMRWLRVASKLKGARRNPMAEPTPAPGGTRKRSMPSFWQSRPAWSGAAPPKAITV